MKKIKKILVANRGEIVLRVFRACAKLGIEAVSIYSEDDAYLPHAKLSGSVSLGFGNSLHETYLNQEKIIDIALKNGCDAIHPGYGFLSEKAEFAKKVEANGLIFIGPNVRAIELMGDKIQSKNFVESLNGPLIPGYHGANQKAQELLNIATQIGFPVLIKASAGGGGKGMRVVLNEGDFISALEMAKSESLKAFGDDKILLEKFIENPRHIEVQVLGDRHGNYVHLFERECSVQRRYQKIIEEAPAANLQEKTKENLRKIALEIAAQIQYDSVGTLEFIVDKEENIYFLEMNTRLQVEHPVTEEVTGVDLVEWQIKVAQGNPLEFSQKDIVLKGHAIECRIYAEDPFSEFLPTQGTLIQTVDKQKFEGRLESGYEYGNSVNTSYDPMLAKVIIHEETRAKAIEKTIEQLKNVYFSGITSNRDFLLSILNHPSFVSSQIFTKTLDSELDQFLQPRTPKQEALLLAGWIYSDLKTQESFWSDSSKSTHVLEFILSQKHEECFFKIHDSSIEIKFKDIWYSFSFDQLRKVSCFHFAHLSHLFYENSSLLVKTINGSQNDSAHSQNGIISPMPGKVIDILVKTGEQVEINQVLVKVEAMKMEHSIKAKTAGRVSQIHTQINAQVSLGKILMEIVANE